MIALTEKLASGGWDELSFSFAPQVVLWSSLKLGIFSAMEGGARSAEEIAAATHCSSRGIRMVLDCLTAMGLVEKEEGRCGLNEFSRRYFVSSSEDYLDLLWLRTDRLMKLWLTLPEAVRTGGPTLSIFDEREGERLNLETAEALFQCHKGFAWKLAELLAQEITSKRGLEAKIRILDVAAGSAVWSIPWALKLPGAKVTAVDWNPVLDVARSYARRFGLEDRYRFIAGDIREADFGTEAYDLVLLGHICHSEGPRWSRDLVRKCFLALQKNGRLLIMDYLPDEERRSELMPLLMAVNALLGSEDGDTFTRSQFQRWLEGEGFARTDVIEMEGHSPILVAVKT